MRNERDSVILFSSRTALTLLRCNWYAESDGTAVHEAISKPSLVHKQA